MLQVYTDGETSSQRIMRASYAIVSGFYIIAVYQVILTLQSSVEIKQPLFYSWGH